jgi:hypothetical protein
MRCCGPTPGSRPTEHAWYVEQERFFEQVGDAFQRLRKIVKLSLEEFLEIKTVRAAVLSFKSKAQAPMTVIRGEWKDHMDAEIKRLREAAEIDDGRPAYARHDEVQKKIEAYRDEQEQLFETKSHQWLYSKFESGDVGAHCNAPLILYTAIAAHFELCPAALSRGVLFALPDAERRRPGKATRFVDQLNF